MCIHLILSPPSALIVWVSEFGEFQLSGSVHEERDGVRARCEQDDDDDVCKDAQEQSQKPGQQRNA